MNRTHGGLHDKMVDHLVGKLAETIYVGYQMQFGKNRSQMRECFTAKSQREIYAREWKELSPENKSRWKTIAKSVFLQTLIETIKEAK